MIDANKVGKHIQTLRKEKGLTQAQLADRLDISYQAVSKWESGTSLPDTALLVDIARILETTVDCILNGGERIMQFERRIAVRDIQNGVDSLANLGRLIGRDTTVYRGMVEGINAKMNIDVEEMFGDAFLLECLVAELLIQNMANGRYVDPTDAKSNLINEKWIQEVCGRAERYGIK